jgi:hypothetical protein
MLFVKYFIDELGFKPEFLSSEIRQSGFYFDELWQKIEVEIEKKIE